MTLDKQIAFRLQFPVRIIRKECMHLEATDQRLFGDKAFTLEQAARLEDDADLAESVGLKSRYCP